eukprot:Blabericola_migrator_1__2772@NODE_1792_length_3786_cov_44_642915_g1156_i0_p1_GENE_NODE_1792_length_3786_cov_44_642915_g1156_i0NODE_1792_length_3786_cov_44_642915_g1156_i0_p1_ORF_typecomplete_len732_score117_56MFS_1/PF07690_16/3_2MFS_1/PF07690_16/6_7e05SMC_N/PF02463_19/0_0012DUF572/PF04502_13/0_375FTHF_cyclig/PF01812_20/0_47Peptidase_A8/PF01252_18/0_14Peptidase_A8/PF01252_18/8_9e02OSTbeta/PF15048_6/9_6e02OSTbeta/PF15048_6/0_11Flot/PF15975_5/7_2PulG/PF11773_8/3_5PulG/PF11773_8/3_9e02DUF4559/PF1511
MTAFTVTCTSFTASVEGCKHKVHTMAGTKRGYITPFGFNRYVILIWYMFVLSLTGFIVGNVDPIRRLLMLNNTALDESENVVEQKTTIESIANIGFAFGTLLSLPVAKLTTFESPRMTGLIALVAFCIGFMLLTLGNSVALAYVGMSIISGSFSASFNAHVTLTALFPNASELVLDCIGSAPDFSAVIPMILLYAAENIESDSRVETVAQIYLGIIICITLVHAFMLPSKPFSEMVSKKFAAAMEEAPRSQRPLTTKVGQLKPFKALAARFRKAQDEEVVLCDLTLLQQLVHPLMFLLIINFSIGMFRRYYILSTFSYTCERYAEMDGMDPSSTASYVFAMNLGNALSWIPTIFFSRVFQDVGTVGSSLYIAIIGFIGTAALCYPSLHLQWVTIVCHFLLGAMMHGNLFTWIGDYFGFRHMVFIQGSVMMIGGAAALGFSYITDLFDQPFIAESPQNLAGSTKFRELHYGLLILSTIALALPFFEMHLVLPNIQKHRKERDAARALAEAEAVQAQKEAQAAQLAAAEAVRQNDKQADLALQEAAMAQMAAQMKQEKLRELALAAREASERNDPNVENLIEQMAILMEDMGIDLDELLSEDDGEDASEVNYTIRRGSIGALVVDPSETDPAAHRPSTAALRKGSRLGMGSTVLTEDNLALVAATSLISEGVHGTKKSIIRPLSATSSSSGTTPGDLEQNREEVVRMITGTHAADHNAIENLLVPEGQRPSQS